MNIINNEDEITNYDKEKILKNDCNYIIINSQIKNIYNDLKNILNSGNYTVKSIIIKTINIIFQLTKLKDQEKTNFFKIETLENNTGTRYVQYEIYNPNNL